MDNTSLTKKIKEFAKECGLDLLGITSPESLEDYISQLDQRSYMYEAGYTKDRIENWKRMARPKKVLPGAKSVIVAGYYYFTSDKMDETVLGKPCGRIGRVLTHGHAGVYKRIIKLAEFLEKEGFKVKGGIHRKLAAVRAGLGFMGKNTLVNNEKFGSWVAYQALATNAQLEIDLPYATNGCGDCRICIDACPTGALSEPYKLDPRRCITYLLSQEEIPLEFRDKIGNRILGCDICQEACPKNKDLVPKKNIESVMPEKLGLSPELLTLLNMDEAFFSSEIIAKIGENFSLGGGTFIEEMVPNTFQKAEGKMLVYLRNVILALGNIGDPIAVPHLTRLLGHPQAFIRSQAAWSLGRIRTEQAKQALREALSLEFDKEVKEEIKLAIEEKGDI